MYGQATLHAIATPSLGWRGQVLGVLLLGLACAPANTWATPAEDLYEAAATGNISKVKELLAKADVNATSPWARSEN